MVEPGVEAGVVVDDTVDLLVVLVVVLDVTIKVVGSAVLVDVLIDLIVVVVDAFIEPASTKGAELLGFGETVLVVEVFVFDGGFVVAITVIVEFTVAADMLLLLLVLTMVGLLITVALD